MTTASLHLTDNARADALMSSNPLALMIGMLLDQQVPMEWAFASPLRLAERLPDDLDVAAIAATDPEDLEAIFRETPALHRYPGSMAKRTQAMCQAIARDIALLAKQCGVAPTGWEDAAGEYALEGHRSIADVTSPESLQLVRDHKQTQKATT